MQKGAGKTSVITGMALNINRDFVYLKPFGDRMVYLKKRLWDQDAALMTKLFNIRRDPEDLSIGFEHSKLRFMHTEESIKMKLEEMIAAPNDPPVERKDHTGNEETVREPSNEGKPEGATTGADLVIIEGGRDLRYGSFVHLDPLTISRKLDAELLIVTHGDDNTIMDSISHLAQHIDTHDVDLKGVIINKVRDVEDFRHTNLQDIEDMGIDVLGTIPHTPELGRMSLHTLSTELFAKVIAGESGFDRKVNDIFVGAMSSNMAQRNPLFRRPNKLLITSGDRSDMILAAIESDSAGIILTNNLIPTASIISKATDRGIPLMVVPQDTYSIAMQINKLDSLLSYRDTEKIDMIKKLVRDNVDLDRIFP